MSNNRQIFFNQPLHKYTDEFDNVYTSVTTLIGKYEEKFDFDGMARACAGKGRHKGMTVTDVKKLWTSENKDACAKGSTKHDYLDNTIKVASGFKIDIESGRLVTISDVIERNIAPTIAVDKLRSLGLEERYPDIFKGIAWLTQEGYKGYSEIGVYWGEYLISGCIDGLFIRDNEFIIFDWKTNKHPLEYRSGYYKKDDKGNVTDLFVPKDTRFKYPLDFLPQASGYIYSMQLSLYAYILELWGYKCDKLRLAHIRDINGKEELQFHKVTYMKNEVEIMINHHLNINKDVKTQYKLF